MFKSIYFLFISLALLGSCKSDEKRNDGFSKGSSSKFSEQMNIPTKDGKVDTTKMAIIKFEETTFDFGKIKEGEVVKHSFKFKNIGAKDLFLLYHKTTCGCTVPSFSKDPYRPGASGEITIVFDSKGKKLSQNKKVKIFANTFPNMSTLTMKGYVIPKEK